MSRLSFTQGSVLGLVLASLALPARAGALESAAQRELVLLAQERDELSRAKEELEALRSARGAGLRAQIAATQARLVSAQAHEKALIADLERAAARPAASPDDDAAVARVLRAAQAHSPAEKVETLEAALHLGVQRAREGVTVRKLETGFFSADGTFVDGAVLMLGAVSAVAASGASAGPAWRAGGGAFEVALADPVFAEQARLLVTRGDAPLVPLALGAPPALAATPSTFWAATARAGAPALLALLLGVLSLALSGARALSLARTLRSARRLAPRVAALILGGELGVAAAECRKVGGAAGRMLLAIVERARSAPGHIERVEERASEVFLDASLALGRGALLASGLLVLSGCAALLGSVSQARAAVAAMPLSAPALLEALIPVERALLVGVPAVLAALAAHALVRLVRHELERGMVRAVDAVAGAGRPVQ
jgi:hypothetical protein